MTNLTKTLPVLMGTSLLWSVGIVAQAQPAPKARAAGPQVPAPAPALNRQPPIMTPFAAPQTPALPAIPNVPLAPGVNPNQFRYNMPPFGAAAVAVPPYPMGYGAFYPYFNYGIVYSTGPNLAFDPASPMYNPYAGSIYGNPWINGVTGLPYTGP